MVFFDGRRCDMRTIAAGKAKAQFLGLLNEVRNKREPVIVTKHGKEWAKIVPLDIEEGEDPLDAFRFPGIEIVGDVMKPIYTDAEWEGFHQESLRVFE
jgi:prevent-host-death family protein